MLRFSVANIINSGQSTVQGHTGCSRLKFGFMLFAQICVFTLRNLLSICTINKQRQRRHIHTCRQAPMNSATCLRCVKEYPTINKTSTSTLLTKLSTTRAPSRSSTPPRQRLHVRRRPHVMNGFQIIGFSNTQYLFCIVFCFLRANKITCNVNLVEFATTNDTKGVLRSSTPSMSSKRSARTAWDSSLFMISFLYPAWT